MKNFNIFKQTTFILFLFCLFSTATIQAQPPSYQFAFEWSKSGKPSGDLYYPREISIDPQGNVYTLDSVSIKKFDNKGNFLAEFLKQNTISLTGLVVNNKDYIYTSDLNRSSIQKIDAKGTVIAKWGSQGTGDGQFDNIQTISFHQGHLYIADYGNNRLQKLDTNGKFKGSWNKGIEKFSGIGSTHVDKQGNIYVSNHKHIQKLSTNGTWTEWLKTGTYALATDNQGNVFVAGNNEVKMFDSSGTLLTKWGSKGKGQGQFDMIISIAVDQQGNVYVADYNNNRIQKFTTKLNIKNTEVEIATRIDQALKVKDGILSIKDKGTWQECKPNQIVKNAKIEPFASTIKVKKIFYLAGNMNRFVFIGGDDRIYEYTVQGKNKIVIPSHIKAKAIDISMDMSSLIGGAGLWIIGDDNFVHKYEGVSQTPKSYSQSKKAIALTVAYNTPSIVGTDSRVYTGTNGNWTELTGADGSKDITTDRTGRLWILKKDNSIHYHDGKNWKAYTTAPKAVAFSVNHKGKMIVYGTDDKIHELDITFPAPPVGTPPLAGKWTALGLAGSDIAVDDSHRHWIVGTDNTVYYQNNGWKPYAGKTPTNKVATDSKGNVWIINRNYFDKNKNGSMHLLLPTGNWKLSGGSFCVDLAIDDAGRAWYITGGHAQGVPTDKQGHPHPSSYPTTSTTIMLSAVDVQSNGALYIIASDNKIHKANNNTWVEIPGAKGKDIAVEDNGRVWIIGMNDEIQFHDGNTWTPLTPVKKAKAVSVNNKNNLSIIATDNQAYHIDIANIKAAAPPAPKPVAKLDPFILALQWNLPGLKDIVSDDVGNIYALAGHEIHKFDTNGKLLSKWGKQGSGTGEFNNPTGITLDSQGSLYIADAGNNRIQKMDIGGTFSLWATAATFSSLQKIATDMNDNIYVADASGYQKFDFNGTLISAWKGTVTGLAVDHSETVFAAGDNTNVQRIDNSGTLSKKWATSSKNSDIALDSFGDIHVVSSGSPVEKYDFDGKLLTKWGPSANAVTMDFAENLYLADNTTIKKYKRTPEILLEMQGTWQNDADPTDRFEIKGRDFTNLKTNQKQSIRIYPFATVDATTFPDEDFMGNHIYRGGNTFNQSDADAMWEFDQVAANKMTLYLTPSGANPGQATYTRK